MHEWGTTLGLQTVTAKFNPCPYCNCNKSNMYDIYHACSVLGLPWEEHGDMTHEAMCAEREHAVTVDSEAIRNLIIFEGRPVYAKGKKARGRA
eukprot:2981996-Pyramimonas_sp.AAC.1